MGRVEHALHCLAVYILDKAMFGSNGKTISLLRQIFRANVVTGLKPNRSSLFVLTCMTMSVLPATSASVATSSTNVLRSSTPPSNADTNTAKVAREAAPSESRTYVDAKSVEFVPKPCSMDGPDKISRGC